MAVASPVMRCVLILRGVLPSVSSEDAAVSADAIIVSFAIPIDIWHTSSVYCLLARSLLPTGVAILANLCPCAE